MVTNKLQIMIKKLKSLQFLSNFSKKQKKIGKKIVLCHGDFDLLHLGHVKHFKSAKNYGDYLIVSVTSKKYIKKGINRPYFSDNQRLEFLSELEMVDYVYLDHHFSAENVIKNIKPNFYAKGADYKNISQDPTQKIKAEKKILEKYKGKILITEEETFSSSFLINNQLLSRPLIKTIKSIKKQYSFELISSILNKMKKKKILVIGDTIIDEYIHTTPLGKPSKENILACNYNKKEQFLGGIFAAVGNLSSFSDKVDFVTAVSNTQSEKNFIKKNLPKNINRQFFVNPKKNTTKKTRFLMSAHSHAKKVFEIYEMNDSPLDKNNENKVIKFCNDNLKNYDLVIVNDYGHGFMTDKIIKVIEKKSKFLAVNAQINAGNQGYNLITKYKKADYVCLDLEEAKRAIQKKDINHKQIIDELFSLIEAKYISVTIGSEGSISREKNMKINYNPAFTNIIVDTISAGDTYFATSSMVLFLTKSLKLSSFIGNLSGALAVGLLGCKPIDKNLFIDSLNSYLKT